MVKIKLAEACLKIGSGATPCGGKNIYCEDGISLIRSQNILDFDFSENGLAYINDDQAAKLKNVEVMEEDVLLNITGDSVARVAMMDRKFLPARVNQHVAIIRAKKEIIEPSYILYYLQYQKRYLLQLASAGATRKALTKSMIENLELELPAMEIQGRIVSILDNIQEKIATNRRINNNLEQQMQALFNEYLSSNKFYDLTTVKDVVLSANTGADAIQKAPIVDYDTGIRCIRVGDMTNNRSFHDWGFTKATDAVFKRYQLHKDDIVVTRTASLGLNTIIPEDLPAVYNNGLIRLTVNTSNVLPLYLFRQFQTEDFSNYIACIESETSVRPNMKINYLLKYEFVLPPITKQNEIIALLTPMLNQQNNLIVENKHLEALRDTLLPKLMSGELDVSKINI